MNSTLLLSFSVENAGMEDVTFPDEGALPSLATDLPELIRFYHHDTVAQIVSEVSGVGVPFSSVTFQKFDTLLQYYQEQPELLDPHLESLITPFTDALKGLASHYEETDVDDGDEASKIDAKVTGVCRYLQSLTRARGHKAVLKFYAVDVACFHPVLKLLDRFRAMRGEGVWETQCQLMLWLSGLVLVPFNLSILDTEEDDAQSGGGTACPPMARKILEICEQFLVEPGVVRDFACVLIYRLLSRADMKLALNQFIAKAEGILSKVDDQDGNMFLAIGMAQALGWIFKHCQREIVASHSDSIFACVLKMVNSEAAQKNLLLRKLSVKLCQRVGLTFLEPKRMAWHYVKQTRVLNQSLTDQPSSSLETANPNGDEPQKAIEKDAEENYDVPEEIEGVVEILLQGIVNRDTTVRWSSAKGIGRICSRLPKSLVDEVLGTVLDSFSPNELDATWHGACLTVAELARRGLLLPETIPKLVPLIKDALLYDVNKGSFSVGAHVRDSAAYVCWACARSYEPDIMAPYMTELAPVLMTVACTDREVNCRRSASASYQECVGRIGNVPDGIEILSVADYFALSTRPQAYLNVCPAVAHFEPYRMPIIENLLNVKLRHWDGSVRQLSAEGLAKLVPTQPDFFAGECLDSLLEWCLNDVLNVRHGAGLGLAAVVESIAENGCEISEDRRTRIGNIVMDIEKARLYRGKGGEIMRQAVCKMIASIAKSGVSDSPRRRHRLLKSVDENLKHPKEEIQGAAVDALHALSRCFSEAEWEMGVTEITVNCVGKLSDMNVAIRRGSAMALGALPRTLLQPKAQEVIDALCRATEVEDDPEDRDAESRVCAVNALISAVMELYGKDSDVGLSDLEFVLNKPMVSLMNAMEDYSTDNRGDVGSWVRGAAMVGLKTVLTMLAGKSGQAGLDVKDWPARVVAILIRNSVERIGKIRETAAECLQGLVKEDCVKIPEVVEIKDVVDCPDALSMFRKSCGIVDMCRFLNSPHYRFSVLEGLVASVGGLDKNLSDSACKGLFDFLDQSDQPESLQNVESFGGLLLDVWEKYARSWRLSTPLFKTTQSLLKLSPLIKLISKPDSQFPERLLDVVKTEVRQCRDVGRLLVASTVLVHLTEAETISKSAWKVLMVLLGSRFPRVRKGTAEIIYEHILFKEEDDEIEKLMDLLLETVWDGGMENVLDARTALCGILGVDPPVRKRKAESTQQWGQTGNESLSYQTLVEDAARGM